MESSDNLTFYMAKEILRLAKRYAAVIFFPTFAATTIYADWSYTQEWKRLQLRYAWIGLPLIGFAIGHFLDKKETERMTLFRDKSALYGRPEDPNREPSW